MLDMVFEFEELLVKTTIGSECCCKSSETLLCLFYLLQGLLTPQGKHGFNRISCEVTLQSCHELNQPFLMDVDQNLRGAA